MPTRLPRLYLLASNWLWRLERMSNRRRSPWLKPWVHRTRTFLFPREITTGLYGRTAFIQRMEVALAKRRCGALLLIDIDKLAWVNHALGHERGDECIQRIASLVRRVAARRLVGRVSGDEFAVYAKDGAEAGAMAEQIRRQVEQEESFDEIRTAVRQSANLRSQNRDNSQGVLTVSIAVVQVGAMGSVEQMLQAGGAAMDDAKRGGGNRLATAQVSGVA